MILEQILCFGKFKNDDVIFTCHIPFSVIFDFDKIGTGKCFLRAICDTYTC